MKNVKSGHKCPIVCLDAGHYGKYNRSPAVPTYYESDMVWKLHNYLADELKKYGIDVKKTRTNQATDLGLKARGQASEGSDLFLSLHSNAVGSGIDESVDYVAVYHLHEDAGTDVDDKSKTLAKAIAPVIASTMGVKQGSKVLTRKGSGDYNGDGVLNDNYYGVLNGARLVNTPGLILEHSFHTNTKATNWLLNDSNLKKLAEVEAKVIAEYFDVAKVAQTETGVLYRVQVGAYSKKENAEAMVKKLKAAGYDAIIKTEKVADKEETPAPVPAVTKKTNAEIAKEIYHSTCSDPRWDAWGNGSTRTERLKLAGYDPVAVQKEVNKLF